MWLRKSLGVRTGVYIKIKNNKKSLCQDLCLVCCFNIMLQLGGGERGGRESQQETV